MIVRKVGLVNSGRNKQKPTVDCFASPEAEKGKEKTQGKWNTKGVVGAAMCCSVF